MRQLIIILNQPKKSNKQQQMEDTQKYLNSSVPNQWGFSKNGNNVTRLPKRQQKLQQMPTVFRVKHQTTYKATGVMPGILQSKNPLLASKSTQVLPLKKQDSGQNQRVEYVAISKRIQSKKQQFTAPTVDVSKYRQTTYIPPQQVTPDYLNNPNQNPNSIYKQQSNNSAFYQNMNKSVQNYSTYQPNNFETVQQQNIQNGIGRQANMKPARTQVSRTSQISQISQQSKRKKIFGFSKQKSKNNIQ